MMEGGDELLYQAIAELRYDEIKPYFTSKDHIIIVILTIFMSESKVLK